MRAPTPAELLIDPLADAYARAARSGANMRSITEALEGIRDAALGEHPLFHLWRALDEQTGRADAGPVRDLFVELRERIIGEAQAVEIRRLQSRFDRDRAGGTVAWLEDVARCFGDGNWRYPFLEKLVAVPWPVEEQLPAPFNERRIIERLARLAPQQRWAELYEGFLFLGRHPGLPAPWRCRQLLLAGEVQLFLFRQPTRADELFREAEALDPRCPRVPVTRAEWLIERGGAARLAEAKALLLQLTVSDPRLAEAWVNLGDLAERDGDFSGAESWFRQALTAAPGSIDGPIRLFRLFLKTHRTRADWRESHAAERAELAARVLVLDPTIEPVLSLEAGDTLRGQGLRAVARAAYGPAREHPRTRLSALIGCAYAAGDEANAAGPDTPAARQWLDQAREDIRLAREFAPEAPDGIWAEIWLAEVERRWDAAAAGCQDLLTRHPHYAAAAGLRVAEIRRQAGDYAAAAAELRCLAEGDPALTGLGQAINDLGEDAYRKGSNEPLAEELFRLGDRVRGESFRHDFLNRLGNLRYWQNRSQEAVDLYRQAIAAKPEPKDPVHFSNLAIGLEKIRVAGQRIAVQTELVAALREAVRLGQDPEYAPRLAAAEQLLEFLQRFGDAALDLKLTGTPIRVTLHSSLLPAILADGRHELSQITLDEVHALRERFRQSTGVPVPGILFSDLGDAPGEPGQVWLSVADDQPGEPVRIQPGPPPESTRALLDCVESLLQPHLARFVTHQEVAALLATVPSPAAALIRQHPRWLSGFVAELRRLIAADGTMVELAGLADEFVKRKGTPPAAESLPAWTVPPPEAVFEFRYDAELYPPPATLLGELQQPVAGPMYAMFGVLLPQANLAPKAGLAGVVLAVGASELPVANPSEGPAEELGRQFLARRADLFDRNQLAHRMILLESTHPVLITAVRTAMSLDSLHARLVGQLGGGGHLKNLPDVLEQLLESVS